MSQTTFTAEDLYLYSMHLLEPEESERLEEFLQRSSEARAELLNVRRDVALLSLAVESLAPPETSRQRLLNQIAREKRPPAPTPVLQSTAVAAPAAVAAAQLDSEDRYTPSAVPPREGRIYEDIEPSRSFFERLLPWAGWAVAAGLGFTTWTYYQRSSDFGRATAAARIQAAQAESQLSEATEKSANAELVVETLRSHASQRFLLTAQGTPPAPSARVAYLAESGSVVFQGSDLEKLPAAKTYELWLIPADKTAKPIPAGTFKPDARGYASVILPTLPKGVAAGTFGVTMEDEGGSTTPTLPILLVGA